ncbi:SRPBCC family protein [Frankia sp. AgB1.9]|uniref:SRPBCC family protein n=1 Tax=unclassified Frankia TaxID=2632575 RepID=UPI0019331E89|nr:MULTISPECIES: SRPBCC family protein [unclassified Frankia]MBL7493353.1 SRPBCC family protein [Frankia sp. AgW1.1]MBL7552898.1 SRPBCC family protein [Frankia sp. AgB1.9]MBL7621075.1 SRPBCC family protein [Frankia sp. AgB1.8]
MELVNEFRVPLPVANAWELLTDPERIAPCMPGAQLLSVDGADFHGAVKVKVGPIVAQYKGKATFLETDTTAHRAVIKADGKESRGQGNASAVVTMVLTPDGDETGVHLTTDLTISGKAAQFGRGVLADVSSKLVAQFVRNLEADILASRDALPAAETPLAETPAVEAPVAEAPGAEITAAAPAAVEEAQAAEAPAPAPTDAAPPVSPAPSAAPVVAKAAPESTGTPAPVAQASVAQATSSTASPPGRPVVAAPVADVPVNLLGVVAWPLLKRALPVIGAVVLALLIWLVVRAAQS